MIEDARTCALCYLLLFVGLASSSQPGCNPLAEQGDCDFYKCQESRIHCGDNGYALGYGYRYCTRFTQFYDDFDADGKVWVDEVRKCLMRAIAPFYNGADNCDTIKEIAFYSHVDCYLDSGKGFCAIALPNWLALWNVYQIKDFYGPDAGAAWQQVLDTLEKCITDLKKDLFDNIEDMFEKLREFIEEELEKLGTPPNVITHVDVTSQCADYANAGDCRFYRCFQETFPCDVFGASHIADFELRLCEDLDTQSAYFDSQGKKWLEAYNKLLMQTLLPLYNQGSVQCVGLHRLMFRHRVDHLVDSGFCGVTDSTHNRWALDLATDLSSYPALLPDKAGLSIGGSKYFYSELSVFRRFMGYANYACYKKKLKKHETFYASVHTQSGVRLIEQS